MWLGQVPTNACQQGAGRAAGGEFSPASAPQPTTERKEPSAGRRNLNDMQRAELALQLEPLIREKAKANLGGFKGNQHTGPMQNPAKDQVTTRDDLAKIAGVSHFTISKVEKEAGR